VERPFVHYEFYTRPGDLIEVSLTEPATVRLLDEANFRAFRAGQPYHPELTGETSPVRIGPPYEGCWHVVVEPVAGATPPGTTARLVRAGH
jgi:hypothetical protein